MGNDLISVVKKACKTVVNFCEIAAGLKLRKYQVQPALAIVDSAINHRGLSFVVMFPRQSGKNELQAQIESYLLTLFSQANAEIVKVSPTWKPQSQNAMRRLERTLQKNLITRIMWSKESGYIYRIGNARIFFFSGSPEANIVGATASTLLEVDEAQDVQISKYDKDIAPMAASTNATRVFWGTAWTSRTLLARELRAARIAEKEDGIQRVFFLTCDDVSKEVPAYAQFVKDQVSKLGRNHPMIRTQYYSEEIDAEGGLFPPDRVSMLTGDHKLRTSPEPGKVYAMLIDVAGEDEVQPSNVEGDSTGRRDSTALTVVEVDLATIQDPLILKPSYRPIYRRSWTGVKHTTLYHQIRALVELWGCRHVVIDATGVGAGLASFLDQSLPGKVQPFTFTGSSKSQLGWDFLSVIDSGRYKEPSPMDPTFKQQLVSCQYEIVSGPEKKMKWGVPDGTRDTSTGEFIHDDLLLSSALVAQLDALDWSVLAPALIIQAKDPLKEMDRGF